MVWHAPKPELLARLQKLLETKRLHIAERMREAGTLWWELLDIKSARRGSGRLKAWVGRKATAVGTIGEAAGNISSEGGGFTAKTRRRGEEKQRGERQTHLAKRAIIGEAPWNSSIS
jgi:hypothetical protein